MRTEGLFTNYAPEIKGEVEQNYRRIRAGQGHFDDTEPNLGFELTGYISKDNADFICLAVNSHDELVASLKYYFDVLAEVRGEDWDKNPDHVLAKMLEAYNKATV